MFLEKVTKGKVAKPILALVYGPDGVGKSTFASKAPNPIFLGSEEGTHQIDVARFPTPAGFPDVLTAIDELRKEKHDYQTLVVDSLDWLEPIIWKHVCAENNWKNIEAPGYGKGYVTAAGAFMTLIGYLRQLREERGMGIILLAHSQIKTFQDPSTNVAYDRYQVKLHEKPAAMFREFVDAVLFAQYEVYTKGDVGKKGYAFGDGKRVFYTERRPAFDAKNRYGLPFMMDLDWPEFEKAARTSEPDIQKEIQSLLANVTDPELKKKVEDSIKKAGQDKIQLGKILDRLKLKVGEQNG